MPRSPCRTCPWRVGQHADEIPNFRLELAEGLDRTTSDQFGAPIFACHQSKDDQEVVCVGWLWRYGWDSIAIRLRMLHGEMRPEELELPDGWDAELHETWDEVITKLRADCAGEECVFCGERKGPDSFEDGLRCKTCAEEQDDPEEDR